LEAAVNSREPGLTEPPVRELQEELSELRRLKTFPGFAWLLKVAEDQVKSRTEVIILTPLSGVDAALEQEYKKGEISGIKLFSELVDIRIDELERDIEQRIKETGDGRSSDGIEREYPFGVDGTDESSFGGAFGSEDEGVP
jgi:hypothetical protein